MSNNVYGLLIKIDDRISILFGRLFFYEMAQHKTNQMVHGRQVKNLAYF